MTETELPDDIKAMSFEQALEELRGIVDGLERGDGSLDQSIKAYERGSLLRMHCDAKLREAHMKIEQIRVKADGTPTSEPFDA
ncbi:MAG: exodeoxyribonuclease VII small subunit [Alphaproteobacteria bacterium]|jgi:exodeoxyribonuclease VII small subunit|nr:exodeoxyribonuclease VII small subunit [Geminicoccus sp.]MEC8037009.1 exodeoxyribonuclease VII small subunit [Pseudomonadota bacterium]MEC8275464.1 exodeoxyribonuclease VII small subunit [Pseudomonadota bacterium]MEC8710486.1 exodeoxyribonuclease VII small subunit [Pseudomonadota bacterium]HCH99623.1 exodeoxyribonuclease VII small subunit [Alphaproteobacteria bacterium]|tara:strand:+ start:45 stop:293 length:249 start_codon:yes stop_codon:yes gene_type:complete